MGLLTGDLFDNYDTLSEEVVYALACDNWLLLEYEHQPHYEPTNMPVNEPVFGADHESEYQSILREDAEVIEAADNVAIAAFIEDMMLSADERAIINDELDLSYEPDTIYDIEVLQEDFNSDLHENQLAIRHSLPVDDVVVVISDSDYELDTEI